MIMDAFNSLADRSGVVRTKELGTLMKRLGENPTKEEVQVSNYRSEDNKQVEGLLCRT